MQVSAGRYNAGLLVSGSNAPDKQVILNQKRVSESSCYNHQQQQNP